MKLIIALLACISLWVSSIFVDGIRLTSLVLSSALIMSSITVHRLICAPGIDWNKVNDFVGTLINLYFVVLITQQFGSLIGVQGFNSSTSAIELYKYNSLSSEASIAARSCFLLFTLKNYLSRKPVGLKPWVVYGYIMLSSGSALGVFLFVISSLLYMNKRLRLFFRWALLLFSSVYMDTEIQRLLAVISFLGQGELDAILAADHIDLRELFTNPVSIGYGIDSSSDLQKLMFRDCLVIILQADFYNSLRIWPDSIYRCNTLSRDILKGLYQHRL